MRIIVIINLLRAFTMLLLNRNWLTFLLVDFFRAGVTEILKGRIKKITFLLQLKNPKKSLNTLEFRGGTNIEKFYSRYLVIWKWNIKLILGNRCLIPTIEIVKVFNFLWGIFRYTGENVTRAKQVREVLFRNSFFKFFCLTSSLSKVSSIELHFSKFLFEVHFSSYSLSNFLFLEVPYSSSFSKVCSSCLNIYKYWLAQYQ